MNETVRGNIELLRAIVDKEKRGLSADEFAAAQAGISLLEVALLSLVQIGESLKTLAEIP